MSSSAIQTFNNQAGANSDFNATNTLGQATSFSHSNTSTGKLDDGAYANVVNRLRYDSSKYYAYMSAPGYDDVAHGNSMSAVAAINAVRFSMMACFAPGDYIRVKKVKITQYNTDEDNADYIKAMDIISKLPESIVAEGDSASNVTKNLNIVSPKGVTWTSSDGAAANPATGAISKWYDPQEVVITATIYSGQYAFAKEYHLTIAGDENVKKENLSDETFVSEADMENWTFASLADGVIADYSVDDSGIKVSKITTPEVSDNATETKRYFAYYDLYTEAKSDEYTSTATKDLQGVYDISIKVGDYKATSKVPMNVGVGYRKNTTFYAFASLVFNAEGVNFIYNQDAETVGEIALDNLTEALS